MSFQLKMACRIFKKMSWTKSTILLKKLIFFSRFTQVGILLIEFQRIGAWFRCTNLPFCISVIHWNTVLSYFDFSSFCHSRKLWNTLSRFLGIHLKSTYTTYQVVVDFDNLERIITICNDCKYYFIQILVPDLYLRSFL